MDVRDIAVTTHMGVEFEEKSQDSSLRNVSGVQSAIVWAHEMT